MVLAKLDRVTPSQHPDLSSPTDAPTASLSRLARWFEVGAGGERSQAIEGVRGLAVAMVFLVHFDATFSRLLPPDGWARSASAFGSLIGYHGVNIFFVLSGFLIYRGVVRRDVGYLTFFGRRIRRIYPTFLVVFGIYLGLSLALPSYSKLPGEGRWQYVVANLLLLPGVFRLQPLVTVSWSLSYEIFFYLSLPLVVGLLRMGTWQPRARIAFFAAVPVMLFLFGPIRLHTLAGFLIFVPGMVLGDLAVSWGNRRKAPPRVEWLVIPAILGLTITGVWLEVVPADQVFPAWVADRLRGSNAAIRQMLLIGGAAALLMWTGIRIDGIVGRILRWRPLRYLGNMSYSYYLFHGFTLNVIKFACDRLLPPSYTSTALVAAALPLSFVATVVASAALFLLVEKPFSWSR